MPGSGNQSILNKVKKMILASGLTISELITTAWDSVPEPTEELIKEEVLNVCKNSTEPMKDWEANEPKLSKVLKNLRIFQKKLEHQLLIQLF